MKLYIAYKERREGGAVCEGQEDDEWPDFEPTYITTSLVGAFTKIPGDRNSLFRHSFETVDIDFEVKPGDRVYVATATYSDGDTFSVSYGHLYIIGAYKTYEEADEATKDAEKITDYSVPWNGYFSSLDDTCVEDLKVR